MQPTAKRVLLVEDDVVIQKLLTKLCGKRGIEVVIAGNKASIHDALSNLDHFALFFVDLILPEVTGWEILERIKHHPNYQRQPIVVMTGAILSPAEKEKIMQSAAAVIEKKSFSLPLFNELLDKHLA